MFLATVPGLEARRFTTLAEANEFYQSLAPDQRQRFTLVTEGEAKPRSDRERRVKELMATHKITRAAALRLLRYEEETGEPVADRLARVAERHQRGERVRRIMREKGCTYAWAYHLATSPKKGPSEPPGAAGEPSTGPTPGPE